MNKSEILKQIEKAEKNLSSIRAFLQNAPGNDFSSFTYNGGDAFDSIKFDTDQVLFKYNSSVGNPSGRRCSRCGGSGRE